MKSDTSRNDVLIAVAGRVLEDAAFVFTDDMDPAQRPDAATWDAMGASLVFTGDVCGTLRMWASVDFARISAKNMLGIDGDPDDIAEKGMDALKELLNMIVGNYITEMYGDKPVFNLGLPQDAIPEDLAADIASPDAVWLEAEGSAIMFVIK